MYERLEKLLKERGITPYRLAKDLGLSQSSLSEWKRGNSIPKYERLVRIARYFGVPVGYLTGREEDDNASGTNTALLEQLMMLVKEKLDAPEWSDEQARQNLVLFNSLSTEKQLEALRYLRYLVSQQEAEKQ
jgi:transcriptional regulator with XRE-family HTH domain